MTRPLHDGIGLGAGPGVGGQHSARDAFRVFREAVVVDASFLEWLFVHLVAGLEGQLKGLSAHAQRDFPLPGLPLAVVLQQRFAVFGRGRVVAALGVPVVGKVTGAALVLARRQLEVVALALGVRAAKALDLSSD